MNYTDQQNKSQKVKPTLSFVLLGDCFIKKVLQLKPWQYYGYKYKHSCNTA